MTQDAVGPVDALFETLSGFVKDAAFVLTAAQATEHAWTSVATLLTSYAPATTLTIDGRDSATAPVLAKTATGVTVTGRSSAFFNGQTTAPLAVVATFNLDLAQPNPVPTLSVVATLDAAWSFGTTFASFAGSILDKFNFTGVAPAATATLTLTGAGLTFSGTPTLTVGPLGDLSWLLAGGTIPAITGPIDISRPQEPKLSFSATFPAVPLGPLSGALEVKPVLNLVASPDPSATLGAIVKLSRDVPISADLSKSPYTFQLAIPPFDIPGVDALDNLVSAGGLGQLVPTDLQLPQLTLSDLSFSARSGKDGGITAIAATVSLKAKSSWTIISGALVVEAASVPLAVAYDDKTKAWTPTLTVKGEFSIGSGEPPPLTSVVDVKLPDQTLEVRLKQDTRANLLQLIDQFLGVAGIPFPAESFGLDKLDIDQLDLTADKKKQTFSLLLGVSTTWRIELPPLGPVFELDGVDVAFQRTSNTAPLTLDASMTSPLDMTAEASRDTKGAGWAVSLTQTQPASTDRLASAFGDARWVVGPLLPSQFEGIQLKLDTGTQAYSVKGGATWDLAPADGESFTIRASLDLVSEIDDTTEPVSRTYTGTVSGTLTIFKFEASVAYRFGPDDTNLTYAIAFRGATLRAVRAIDSKAETDTLTVTLTGVTVGGVIDELVSLVVADLGFTLPPPWDALSSVSLDGVSLVADLKKSTVAVSARIGLDLGFATLDSVTLTYGTAADGAPSVAISVDGSFVGLPAEPVGWDLLNDPAPTPPAASPPLVELAFLGIGQNYGFTSATAPTTIADVIAALESEFLDTGPGSGLAFTGTGNWLIGLDLTLMGAVRIEIVFDDPVLYGVRIALSGEKVKSLAGLEFEILYRRISDTLGVYQIELTLPEKFRQMQFGAVSVTLPIVDIDIYTNGNFRLDFGFPVAGDFSRSFCVQAGPFIGYGGFYFALLDGQTSTRVPPITNGSFSPVIEFGLALSVGLGRTFNKGPLSAEATLTFEAMLQGALGWFQPTDHSQPTDLFYSIEGTAAIVGKLYGSVDLEIIKIEVSILAMAQLTVIAEAYEAIDLKFTVEVEVEASLTIVFFTVHFSFSMKLDLSTTIGSASSPPWAVASRDAHQNMLYAASRNGHEPLLRQQRTRHRPRRLRTTQLLSLDQNGSFEWNRSNSIDWTPVAVFPNGAIRPIRVRSGPALTVAAPGGASSMQRIVAAFFVDNGIHPDATSAQHLLRVAARDSSFDQLAAGVLRWSFAAAGVTGLTGPASPGGANGPRITSLAVEQLLDYLASETNREAAFSFDNVAGPSGFLAHNYVAGFEPTRNGPTGQPGTVFPIPAQFVITPSVGRAVDLWNTARVDAAYRQAFETYYDQLRIKPNDASAAATTTANRQLRAARGFTRAASLPSGDADGKTPLSAVVFGDYFAILAKAALQSVDDLLKAYPHVAGPTDSLTSLAQEFGGQDAITLHAHRGDTLASVAASLGIAPHVVERANPRQDGPRSLVGFARLHEPLSAGTQIQVPAGPTVGTIATANQDYPLAAGVPLTIPNVVAQVAAGETIRNLAQTFGFTGPTGGAPNGPAALFSGPVGARNATSQTLLRSGASVRIPRIVYPVQADDLTPPTDPLHRVGAMYYVRGGGPLGATAAQLVPWYMQQIAATGATGPSGGAAYVVPIASLSGGLPLKSGSTTYTPRDAADTIERVAQYFTLVELEEVRPRAFTDFVAGITWQGPLRPGTQLSIPTSLPYSVGAGDSLANVAELFSAGVNGVMTVPALVDRNVTDDILRPLAVMEIPPFGTAIRPGDTLASIAQRYDLTVDDLADGIATVPGIFMGPTGATMTIPDLASRAVDELLEDMTSLGKLNQLASTVSRFLFNGMRVAPVSGTDQPWEPTAGLYDVVGQQFAPAPGASFSFNFAAAESASWIRFYNGPSGPSGPTSRSIDVALSAAFLAANAPSTDFVPSLTYGPTGMTAYTDVPVRYATPNAAHWQSATGPGFPGPTANAPLARQPSLWFFSPSLLQLTSSLHGATGATGPFELVTAARTSLPTASSQTAIAQYAFGMAVELRIQRVLGEDGTPIPHRYLLVGADETGRELLLAAWQFAATRPDARDRLYLLYAPSGGGNSSGFASDALGADVFVLRTNLSTVTHPNNALFRVTRGANANSYHASITQPAAFMQCVWEASVTGSGGFYLEYVTRDGNGLPDALFTDGPEARIRLVYVSAEQGVGATPNRDLFAYNNCAVVGDNVDATSTSLYVQASGPDVPTRRVSAIPSGMVGFELARVNPNAEQGPVARTSSLYHVLSYRVDDNQFFHQSNVSAPIGPATPRGATTEWRYHAVVPIAQFGIVNDAPATTGGVLPPTTQNPYAGITAPTGPFGLPRLSTAQLDLAFHDVFGNALGPSGSVGPVVVPFGYIDDLIGLASWPGAGSSYRFSATGPTGIALQVELSLDTARSIASPSLPFATAAASAAADAARYASIYYQVQQRDLTFALESNLGSPALQGDALKGPLSAFVTGSKVFVDAAASLVGVTGQAAAGATFGGYATTFAVTPGALAEANGDLELTTVFAAQGPSPLEVVQPAILAAPPGHSLVSLADAAGASFSVNQIAAYNASAPLRAGVTLVGIVPLDVTVEPTLAAAAAASDSAVYFSYVDATGSPRETGLVMDNWNVAGLVASGVTVTIGAITRTTTSPTSLLDFFGQFQNQGSVVGRGTFAQAVATVRGLVAPTITSLVSTTYVVPPPIVRSPYLPKPSTLAGLVSLGLGTLDELATANQTITDLFVAGTPILVGAQTVPIPPHVVTLADFARHAKVPLGQFGMANAMQPLVVGANLGVPNLTALPADGTHWAAYTPSASDSLHSIAARFTSPTQDEVVAELNRYLRGILQPGTITIGPSRYPISAGDSLDTLFARVGGTFSTFVGAIAPHGGLFATNATVVVPGPPRRPPASAEETATNFGIQGGVVALFEANRSLRGFLRPQALQLAFPAGPTAPPVSVTIAVGANDTLDTLVRRLGDEQQLVVDLDLLSEVAAAAPDLIDGTPFLLPPNPTLLECTLAPVIPPPGVSPTHFPVTTGVRMSRSPELIAPDFANRESAVESVLSPVSAAAFVRGATGPAAAGTLRTFAAEFEQAFAPYRLKCAVGENASGSGTDRAALFAMNFGPSGIADLTIAADQPQFYGLPPVSTQLISGTYPVVPYGASGASGPLGPTAIQHFEGADPQTWLRTFLAATDLVLSGAYAVPAYLAPGPTGVIGQSYDTIVAAKATIAARLSSRIEPILGGAYTGPSGPARDALYQQMLQQLESAYQTTAVVQYPVTVDAAVSPNGATWPRLFGPVVNPPYRLPSDTPGPVGLTAFASGLGVAPSYLALVVAGQRGLLEPSSTLTFDDKTHTVEAGDTIGSVAGALGVTFPGPTGRDGTWWTNTWVPFIESASGIGSQDSMLAATPLPVTRIVRDVTSGESFAAPAAFFGDPIAFGRANQHVGALLQANQVIEAGPGRRYTTTGASNETIGSIASTLGVTIDDVIAVLESQVPPIVLRAQRLHGAVLTTDFTLSSAKVALTPSAGQTYLTFLLSVADEHAARTQFLNARFAPTDLEYNISDVPGAGNYQSSKWLRLVLPPGDDFLPGTRMPQTQVPIPLRVYPPPPILTANAGTPDVASPATISDAKLWTYAFDVMRAEAPQDEDHIAVSLYRSTRPQPVNRLGAPSRGLIAALAQFAVAWPQLSDDLTQLPVAPGPRTDGAVQAFAFYADAIAYALGGSGPFRRAQPAVDPDLAEHYEFLARRAPGAELTRLTLVSSATGPGATFPAPFPTIAIVGPTGSTAPLAGPVGASGATAVYQYPTGYAADDRLTQRYWFEHRDVARNERAAGGAFVTRNAQLISSGPLGASGPTGAYATNPSFVYQTPLVEFVERLIPSLSCSAAIDLSAGLQRRSLQRYIVDMLNAVVSNAVDDGRSAHWIELVCSYAFSMSGTDDGVFATIPLGLRPTPVNGLLPGEFGQYASDLAQAIGQVLPPGVLGTAGKRISFALRLFTSVADPAGAGTPQFTPILSFDNLFIPVQLIDGLTEAVAAGTSIYGDRP